MADETNITDNNQQPVVSNTEPFPTSPEPVLSNLVPGANPLQSNATTEQLMPDYSSTNIPGVGTKVKMFNKLWQLTDDSPDGFIDTVAKSVVPYGAQATKTLRLVEHQLIDPAIKKAQTAIREEIGMEKDGVIDNDWYNRTFGEDYKPIVTSDEIPESKVTMSKRLAGKEISNITKVNPVIPNKAEVDNPQLDKYRNLRALQLYIGKEPFDGMPEHEKLKAINEMSDFYNNFLGIKGDWNNYVTGTEDAVVDFASYMPLFIFGEGKAAKTTYEQAPNLLSRTLEAGIKGGEAGIKFGTAVPDADIDESALQFAGLSAGSSVLAEGIKAAAKSISNNVPKAIVTVKQIPKFFEDLFSDKDINITIPFNVEQKPSMIVVDNTKAKAVVANSSDKGIKYTFMDIPTDKLADYMFEHGKGVETLNKDFTNPTIEFDPYILKVLQRERPSVIPNEIVEELGLNSRDLKGKNTVIKRSTDTAAPASRKSANANTSEIYKSPRIVDIAKDVERIKNTEYGMKITDAVTGEDTPLYVFSDEEGFIDFNRANSLDSKIKAGKMQNFAVDTKTGEKGRLLIMPDEKGGYKTLLAPIINPEGKMIEVPEENIHLMNDKEIKDFILENELQPKKQNVNQIKDNYFDDIVKSMNNPKATLEKKQWESPQVKTIEPKPENAVQMATFEDEIPPKPPQPPGIMNPDNPPPPSDVVSTTKILTDIGIWNKYRKMFHGSNSFQYPHLAKALNSVQGGKAYNWTKKQYIDAFKSTFTDSAFESEMRKDLLDVIEDKMHMTTFVEKYQQNFDKGNGRAFLSVLRDDHINTMKELQHEGLIAGELSDADLRKFTYQVLLRSTMEPGEWAKLIQKDNKLMSDATNTFRDWFIDGPGLDEAEATAKAKTVINILTGAKTEYNDVVTMSANEKELTQDILNIFDKEYENNKRGIKSDETTLFNKFNDATGMNYKDFQIVKRLIGKHEDGFEAIANTMAKNKMILHNVKTWNGMMQDMPDLFTETRTSAQIDSGWKQLPNDKYKYGQAAGKWVEPEFYDEFYNQYDKQEEMNSFFNDIYKKMTAVSQFQKMNYTSLGNIYTWINNFLSTIPYMTLSGVNPLSREINLLNGFKIMREASTKPLNESGLEFSKAWRMSQDMTRLGVDYAIHNIDMLDTSNKEFIRTLEKLIEERNTKQYGNKSLDVKKNTALPGFQDSLTLRGLFNMLTDNSIAFKNNAGELYNGVDRLARITTYDSLLKKFGYDYETDSIINKNAVVKTLRRTEKWKNKVKSNPQMSNSDIIKTYAEGDLIEELKLEAAYRIKQSFPDPNMRTKVTKALSNVPLIFNKFFTFTMESNRIITSIPDRIKYGETHLIPSLLGMGAIAAAVPYGMQQLRRMNGITDEEANLADNMLSEKIKDNKPGLVMMPFRDGEGRLIEADLGGGFEWLRILKGIHLDNKWQKNIGQFTMNLVEPMFQGSLFDDQLQNFKAELGFDEKYEQKYRENQKGFTLLANDLGTKLGMMPQIGNQIYKAWNKTQEQGFYRESLTTGEAAANLLTPIYPIGPKTMLSTMKKDRSNIRKTQKEMIQAARDRAIKDAFGIHEESAILEIKQRLAPETIDTIIKDYLEIQGENIDEMNKHMSTEE